LIGEKYAHPLVDELKELPVGFTTIERVPGGPTLDSTCANLFTPDKMVPLPSQHPHKSGQRRRIPKIQRRLARRRHADPSAF
jgi:uncharacterized protein YukJ